MKSGQWLSLEMGKAAPGLGEFSSEETFPAAQLLLPNFVRALILLPGRLLVG